MTEFACCKRGKRKLRQNIYRTPETTSPNFQNFGSCQLTAGRLPLHGSIIKIVVDTQLKGCRIGKHPLEKCKQREK